MATFTVDPSTLLQLSSTLSAVHSEMQSMHGVATGFEGLLGGSDLDGEVEGFCSHWGHGISVLAQHMEQVVQSLNYAVVTYGKSETEIQNACIAVEKS
jgi:hypothetical protein